MRFLICRALRDLSCALFSKVKVVYPRLDSSRKHKVSPSGIRIQRCGQRNGLDFLTLIRLCSGIHTCSTMNYMLKVKKYKHKWQVHNIDNQLLYFLQESHSIHTIWILLIGIRSRYNKPVPHLAILLQNGVDVDWYTRLDPSLLNLIILYYLLFSSLQFTPPPPDHSLSSANTNNQVVTIHNNAQYRKKALCCQIHSCPTLSSAHSCEANPSFSWYNFLLFSSTLFSSLVLFLAPVLHRSNAIK